MLKPIAPVALTADEIELTRILTERLNRAMVSEVERSLLAGDVSLMDGVFDGLLTKAETAVVDSGGSVSELLAAMKGAPCS